MQHQNSKEHFRATSKPSKLVSQAQQAHDLIHKTHGGICKCCSSSSLLDLVPVKNYQSTETQRILKLTPMQRRQALLLPSSGYDLSDPTEVSVLCWECLRLAQNGQLSFSDQPNLFTGERFWWSQDFKLNPTYRELYQNDEERKEERKAELAKKRQEKELKWKL